jgi:hypothetical protein
MENITTPPRTEQTIDGTKTFRLGPGSPEVLLLDVGGIVMLIEIGVWLLLYLLGPIV